MQTTISEQVEDNTVPREPIAISLLRSDARIRSIVVIRKEKPAGRFNHLIDTEQGGAKNFEENLADVLTFRVSDLLGAVSYSVTQKESFYELVFPRRHEQVLVAVEPGSDFNEIANTITNHLAVIARSN